MPNLTTEGVLVERVGLHVAATLSGSLAPNGADTHYYFEYGETEVMVLTTPANDAGSASKLEHIQAKFIATPFTFYHYRLVATNAFGTTRGADKTFEIGALISAPVIGPLPPSFVAQFSATLNATLETSEAIVGYRFEYGPTTAYGSSMPFADVSTPITNETLVVSEEIAELQAGTTYHYRLVADSPGGNVTGPDETFTTLPVPPPVVSTGGASNVSVGSATVGGSIDPLGWETNYLIEYGATTAYGSDWPTVPVPMGALEGVQPVVVGLLNLLPKTTYHYRLVATSGGGTVYGADQTFTTTEYAPQVIQEPVTLRHARSPIRRTPISVLVHEKSQKSQEEEQGAPRGQARQEEGQEEEVTDLPTGLDWTLTE